MELSAYYKPLLRLWWLLVLATLVAGVSTYFTVSRRAETYQAKTTLMIGQSIENPNPSSGDFYLASQLASVYANIAGRQPVRDATRAALGLDYLPQYSAHGVPNTQFIEIVVTDFDPQRAQLVANELANQLVLRSPTGELSADHAREDFLDQQIDQLQSQIISTQDMITQLQEKLGGLNSASEIQNTENEIASQQDKLTSLQSTYANLLANTQKGATNTLIIVEPAAVPTTPIGTNKNLVVLIAAAIGFILAAGAAFLLDYLDDTLKTPEDIKRVLGLPVIGYIADTKETNEGKNGLYVSEQPRSPIAESYRSLRANLQLMSEEQPFKSLLITSTNIGVGKTSVAVNLASVMAQGDKRVILIDADLHRPRIHELVNVSNKYGFTDVFLNGLNVDKALISFKNENFKVIPSGRRVENPSELLATEKLDQLFTKLEDIADFVIVDSPPMLVADVLFLAAKVDSVLLVFRPGLVRRKVALAMMEQFNRTGIRVLGVVLNRIPLTGVDAYSGYGYYAAYYKDEERSDQKAPSKLHEYLNSRKKKAQAGIENMRHGKADQ